MGAISNICIGTAQFGLNYGISNNQGKPDFAAVKKIINNAFQNEIIYYDTAQAYGTSEEIIGRAFSELNISNHVKCISKLLSNYTHHSFVDLEKNVIGSLKRLKIKSLWGLLLHSTKIDGKWSEFIDSIKELKKNNLIQNFGVSIYSPQDAIKFVNNLDIDIIQVPFNIMDRRLIDKGFFELAKRNNKIIFIRSIFLQGLLMMNEKRILDKNMKWTLPFLSYLWNFQKIHNLDLKLFILKAVTQYIPDAVIIMGIESFEQLQENIKLFRSEQLNNEIIAKWWTQLPNNPEKLLNPSLW